VAKHSQIRVGAVISYAAVAFNTLAGLLYTPWMISSIGSDMYGLYTLAISVVNFFLLDFGLGDAVSRFLSRDYAEGRLDKANEFMGVALRLYLIISAAIFVVLFGVYLNIDAIYGNLGPKQLFVFKVLYIIVALYSVISLPCASFNGVLTANEQFIALNLSNLLQKVFTVGLIIVALLLGWGVYALVIVNAGVGLVFSLIKYLLIKSDGRIRLSPFGKRNAALAREVLGFSVWVLVIQICARLIFSIMPSIIAAVSTSWEISVFGLASSLEGYVWSVANALNGMFMPKVTRIVHSENSKDGLQRFAVRVGRIQLLITGGIVVGFAAIGPEFVSCWVGDRYSTLYICTLLLVLPELIELPTMVADTAIIAKGCVMDKAVAYIAMAIANVILGIPLSASLGAVGASLAICIAYFIRTFGMFVIYVRRLRFKLRSFFRDTYIGWFAPALIMLAMGYAFRVFITASSWGVFAVEFLACTSVYLVFSWHMMLNESEKIEVRGYQSLIMNHLPKRG